MAKFKAAPKGILAREKGVTFKTIYGQECTVDLGLMSAGDDEDVLLRVSNHLGASKPEGHPAFEFRTALERVFITAIDPESPEDSPELFFGSVNDVREQLDREIVIFLSQRQAAFQMSVSPLQRGLTNEEYVSAQLQVLQSKEGDPDPFGSWAPSLRWSFLRHTVHRLYALLALRSDSSSTPLERLTSATQSSQPH
jgi:hypothetical protein